MPPVERIPCPAPGVYPDVPAETYHRWDAASNSQLAVFDPDVPAARIRWMLDHPKPATDALARGDALHLALLEPKELHGRYAIAQPCAGIITSGERAGSCCGSPGRVKVGGVWKCGVHGKGKESEESRLVLPENVYADVLGMHASVWALPEAAALLRGTQEREVSMVFDWRLPDGAVVRCKCRVDVPWWGMVFGDFKSTVSAGDAAFAKAAADYDYFRQVAFYRAAARFLDLQVPEFLYFPVENTPPYLSRVVDIDPYDVSLGYAQAERRLGLWHRFTTSGEWQGYPAGSKTISLPEWKRASIQREIAA